MRQQVSDYPLFLSVLDEANEALHAPMKDRVAACLVVLPKVVERMTQIALYHTELNDSFRLLKMEVESFLGEVRKAQRMHPEVNFLSGHVRQGLRRIEEIIERMNRLQFQVK